MFGSDSFTPQEKILELCTFFVFFGGRDAENSLQVNHKSPML